MPYIFHRCESQWAAKAVPASPSHLSLGPVSVLPTAQTAEGGSGVGVLMHGKRKGHDNPWVLLLQPGQRVLHNGQPIAAGARVLAHRDSLALEGEEPVFFSTEEAACVEPFAGADPVTCPRCRDAISTGQPAVKCPGCSVTHHETHDRNCWTYAATCALCPQPSALDGALQWSPESL